MSSRRPLGGSTAVVLGGLLAAVLTACSATATSSQRSPAGLAETLPTPSLTPTQPAATQPAATQLTATLPPTVPVPPVDPPPSPPPASSAPAEPSAAPDVDVAAYVVYDAATGARLASRNADAPLAVGSLMKLLNAFVAYSAGDPEHQAVAPQGVGGEAGESIVGLYPGQTISREILIRAMLKASANDAARLLALDIAGSEAAYAEMMNAAAAELGLTGTHAVNASGLDAEGQVSTAGDMITLAATLLDNPTFRQTVSEPTASLNGQTFPNTNDLLRSYPGADGIKTGHTTDAGWCVVASATREGRQIVVAVLGAPTEAARDASAKALLDWAFAQP